MELVLVSYYLAKLLLCVTKVVILPVILIGVKRGLFQAKNINYNY
jgi:hypothetical protein